MFLIRLCLSLCTFSHILDLEWLKARSIVKSNLFLVLWASSLKQPFSFVGNFPRTWLSEPGESQPSLYMFIVLLSCFPRGKNFNAQNSLSKLLLKKESLCVFVWLSLLSLDYLNPKQTCLLDFHKDGWLLSLVLITSDVKARQNPLKHLRGFLPITWKTCTDKSEWSCYIFRVLKLPHTCANTCKPGCVHTLKPGAVQQSTKITLRKNIPLRDTQ